MIYIPCKHRQLHNGGWVEEMHFSIADRDDTMAVAPCMLLFPRAGRVQSWLATLSVVLHRKIVHEQVLRLLLERRYGQWSDFWSIGEIMQGMPVCYQHLSNRYYVLRDVIPFLPRPTTMQGRVRRCLTPPSATRAPSPLSLYRFFEPLASPGTDVNTSLAEIVSYMPGWKDALATAGGH